MSDALPEPSDVGPIAGGGMRASDRDRELVADVLNTAFADGRLTSEELDERLHQALAARTFDDLTPLTRDLVPAPGARVSQVSSTNSHPLVDTSGAHGEPERLAAVFGGAEQKGPVRVRKQTDCLAMFGGINLDWRQATFEAQTVELRVATLCGGVELKLPEGVAVRNQSIGIFGGSEITRTSPETPDGPVIVLKGFCLFGGVSVKGPKPPRASRH